MKHKRHRCVDGVGQNDGQGKAALAVDHLAGMTCDDQDTIDTPLHGQGLMQLLVAANEDCTHGLPVGTRVWAKMRGYCAWPGTTWSLAHVPKGDWPDLLRSYKPGYKLVKFYGEHSLTWVPPSAMTRCAPLPASLVSCLHPDSVPPVPPQQLTQPRSTLIEQPNSAAHGEIHADDSAVDGTSSLTTDSNEPASDISAACGETEALAVPKPEPNPEPDLHALHQQKLTALREWGRKMDRVKLTGATIWEMEGCLEEGAAEVCRVMRLSEVWGNQANFAGNYLLICGCCGENRAEVQCKGCSRAAHALCLNPPSLDRASMPLDQTWICPKCQTDNTTEAVPIIPVVPRKRGRKKRVPEGGTGAANATSTAAQQQPDPAEADVTHNDKERLGLTPDWIIHTVIYHIFGLQRPTPEVPYIAGLLDPATNSKLAPNIPAEKLYDATDNGLDRSNAWAGYWILLNPDYRSQTQWRFVNRAIDEVESGKVPAILLLCRNSTDSAYFQRLRPYPRVLLRRNSAHFKDYNRTTPGFGIAACLLATPEKTDLYLRFLSGFNHSGEASIPIDATFMRSAAFMELCKRLRLQALHQQRDHWVQCGNCGKWRILPYHAVLELKEDVTWTCAMLRPPHTNCRTALTRTELLGIHHGGIADDDVLGLPVWQPSTRSKALSDKTQGTGQATITACAAALPMANEMVASAQQPMVIVDKGDQPLRPQATQQADTTTDVLEEGVVTLPAPADISRSLSTALLSNDIIMEEATHVTSDACHLGLDLNVNLEDIACSAKRESDMISAGITPVGQEPAEIQGNKMIDSSPALCKGLHQLDASNVSWQQPPIDVSMLNPPDNGTVATSQLPGVAIEDMLLDVKQQRQDSMDKFLVEPTSPTLPGTARKSARERKPTAKAAQSAKHAVGSAAAKEIVAVVPSVDMALPVAPATALAVHSKPVADEVMQQAIADLTSIWQSMQEGGVLKELTLPVDTTATPAASIEQHGNQLEDPVVLQQDATSPALPETNLVESPPHATPAAPHEEPCIERLCLKQPPIGRRQVESSQKAKVVKSSSAHKHVKNKKSSKPSGASSSRLKLHVSTAMVAAGTALTRTREIKAPRRLDPGAQGMSARALNALRRKQGLLGPTVLPARRTVGHVQPGIARLTEMLQNAKVPVAGQATVEIEPRLPRKRTAQTNQSTATATQHPGPSGVSRLSHGPSTPAVGSQVMKAATAHTTAQKPWGNPSVPLIGRKARGHASVAAILATRSSCKGITKQVKAVLRSTQKPVGVIDPVTNNVTELNTALAGCSQLMNTLQTWLVSAGIANVSEPCRYHVLDGAAEVSRNKPISCEAHVRDEAGSPPMLNVDILMHDDKHGLEGFSASVPHQHGGDLREVGQDQLVLLSPSSISPAMEDVECMQRDNNELEKPAVAVAVKPAALDGKSMVGVNLGRPASSSAMPNCSVLVSSMQQLHAQLETVAQLLKALNLSNTR